MNETSPSPTQDHRHDEVASTDRRRLLRAAVSAAPIIATLPSGAALAQASTSQCILDSMAQSAALPPPTPAPDAAQVTTWNVPVAPPDGWLRVPAVRTRFKRNGFADTAFCYNFYNDTPPAGNWYRENNGVKITLSALPGDWAVAAVPATTYRQVLVMRMPVPDGVAPEGLATSPACNYRPGVDPTGLPFDGCIFSLAERQGGNGNTAIQASCWTSFA